MTLSHITDQIAALPDAEFEALRIWVAHDALRRQEAPGRQQAQAELVAALREQDALPAPPAGDADTPLADLPAWQDPGTLHADMYLPGNRVLHDGRVWESTHPGLNHWRPGSPGVDYRIWRDITPEPDEPADPDDPDAPPALPAWDPQGHPYKIDDRFTYQGVEYRVIQNHASQSHWTPDAVPSLYATV